MKILILSEFFAPAWGFGGPPKVLFDIARELVRRQHSVTVYSTNVLDAQNKVEKPYTVLEGVNVYYLKTLSKWLAWNQKIFLPIGLTNLLKENIENFDIIILTPARTIFSFIGYRQATMFNKPYIFLPYGGLPRGKGIKKILKWVIDPLFGYRMLRDASFVFAQTDHEMLESSKYGARDSSIRLVPLNVDLSEFENPPLRGNFRTKLGIKDEEKLILFLGRLHEYKGIDLLLKAFSHLTEANYPFKLVIVGRDDGYLSSMLNSVKKLGLEGKVIFVGPLYGKDRITAYVDADVFVMPSSYFEETSTAALEACAASTPVIVTRQASIPGLDKHQAGITINYDQKELEDALLKILKNDQLRVKMGENARKLVKEEFSLAAVTDRFEEAFRNIERQSLAKLS